MVSDIMSDNINTNTMMGKVVAVCIALLFIVVLAFPVANSLSNLNGNSDGNEALEKTVINSYGLEQNPYKSYEEYESVTTPVMAHAITITLDDLRTMSEKISTVGYDPLDGKYFLLLSVQRELFVGPNFNLKSLDVYYDGDVVRLEGTWSDSAFFYGTVEELDSFTLTIAEDYTVSASWSYTSSDDVNTTTGIKADRVILASESEYGWGFINYHETSYTDSVYYLPSPIRCTVGSQLFCLLPIVDVTSTYFQDNFYYSAVTITEDMISDNTLSFTVPIEYGYLSGDFPSSWDNPLGKISPIEGYSCEFTFELQPTDEEGMWQITLDPGTRYIVHTPTDETGEGGRVVGISTYGLMASEGSSSDSSLGGVASTLIKLVPIILIVSLLLVFIVPMVYKPN